MKYNVYNTYTGKTMVKEEVVRAYARSNRYDTCDECPEGAVTVLGGRASEELPFVKFPVCTDSYALLDLRRFAIKDENGRPGGSFRLRSKSNATYYIDMMKQLQLAKNNRSALSDISLIRFNAELITSRISATLSLDDSDKEYLRYSALAYQLVQHANESNAKMAFMFKKSLPFCDLKDSEIYELLGQEGTLHSMLEAIRSHFPIGDRLSRLAPEVLHDILLKSLTGFAGEVALGLELLPVQAVLIDYALNSPLGRRSSYGNIVANTRKSKLIDIDAISQAVHRARG